MYRLLGVLLCGTACSYSQEMANVLKYDYSMFYNSRSAALEKHHLNISFTDSIASGFLAYSASANIYNIDYKTPVFQSVAAQGQYVHHVNAGISWSRKLNRRWAALVSFTPELNTATQNSISITNVYPVFFMGAVQTTNSEKPSRLTLGGGYSSTFGKPKFLPFISFHQQLNRKMSYTIGTEKLDFEYKVNGKNSIRSFVAPDSFYARNNSNDYFSAVEMLSVNGGFEYRYQSQDYWDCSLKLGHSLYNSMKIFDSREQATTIDFDNTVYISMGFKYNLNF